MAIPVDVTPILQACQSQEAAVRQQGEAKLRELETNAALYFQALSGHISNQASPVDTRMLAGLVLKNALDSKDSTVKRAQAERWIHLDESVRQGTKGSLLTALSSPEAMVSHTAALVIAKVAAIEIPKRMWNDLLPMLIEKSKTGNDTGVRIAALEALGYTCEELGMFEDDYLEEQEVNHILTGVVTAMRPEDQDAKVRFAATMALYNALDFADRNFERDNERQYIMETICYGTIAQQADIRKAAWECLVRVAENYYEKLPAYIAEIFNLTKQALSSTSEREEDQLVSLQALEFWSTIADEEYEILADRETGDSNQVYHAFISNALQPLVPLLMEQLTKQDELADLDGSWNLSLAAGSTLGLAASVAGDPIVQLVMPFVEENIKRNGQEQDWRFREAATFAFGCILDGPQVGSLGDLARHGLQFLFNAFSDPNPLVKNTTVWAVGRIFQFVHGELSPPLLNQENLGPVVEVLLGALDDEVHIAEKVCYAISQLASGFSAMNDASLSPYFDRIVGKLLETAARPIQDPGEAARLQIQAFEALNEVVRASSQDAILSVAHLIPHIADRIRTMSSIAITSQEAQEHQINTLNLLCGVLNVITTKLCSEGETSRQYASQQADNMMNALLTVFALRQGYVSDEAMLAVGALTYATEQNFLKYMEVFLPFLEKGLQQAKDQETCSVTLGVLGDLCGVLQEHMFKYCDGIMHILRINLEDPEVPREVKPQILAAYGDIALAIGDNFVKYLGSVVPTLQSAAELGESLARDVGDDQNSIDYINALRGNILDAWSGMFNGLSKEQSNQYLKASVQILIEYIRAIVRDENTKDITVWGKAAAALGDIAFSIPETGSSFRQAGDLLTFLGNCRKEPELEEKTAWALKMVQAAISSAP